MLMDLAVRFMAPVLIALAGVLVIAVIRLAGGTLEIAIRVAFAILTGVLVGVIRLTCVAGRGVRELYWRLRD